MSVSKLSTELAFSEGSDLWVIKNDPSLYWWQQLDLHSSYLLSENFIKKNKEIEPNIKSIVEATNLNLPPINYEKSFLLLGTSIHFLNKWVLIWDGRHKSQVAEFTASSLKKLNSTSVRFFSDFETLENLAARPTASSLNISYVENI